MCKHDFTTLFNKKQSMSCLALKVQLWLNQLLRTTLLMRELLSC